MADSDRSHKPKRDIYQEVTDRIIGYLEQGTAPWRNPIKRGTGDGWPKNLESGKRYRGINVFLLGLRAWESGYSSDYWVTFNQARAKGGQVRKGEKGSLVTFFKMHSTKDKKTEEEIEVPVLKHFIAFNVEQVEGIEIPDAPASDANAIPFEPLDEAERIVLGYTSKPLIKHDGGSRAFYRPGTDSVHMPKPERFDERGSYYSTLFHELSHSTGHSDRLNRGLDTELAPFGSPDYSREELIAEMGAAFLCAVSGISPPTIEQSASYLKGWINVLRGDNRLVVRAAGAAQKAADWILGDRFNETVTVSSPKSEKQESTADENESKFQSRQPPSQRDLF
ncbi:zincin-like metallopeptidase domain-containing protein [Bremerella sp. JC770]|uniref:ArdC family protein n=1 Tax=Bremerella sp. JC770 TaxID=3232137 RepID=UPI003458B3F9